MSDQRAAVITNPCPGCGSCKVIFKMTQSRLDGATYSYREGRCLECESKRFGGLRIGTSNARPEGSPHKRHFEMPTDSWSGYYAQCSFKKGKGTEGRYCARHARQVAERKEAAERCQATIQERKAS